jgi:hypothetical protein
VHDVLWKFFPVLLLFSNFNEYEKSNLDHVHIVVLQKKEKSVRGMEMNITQYCCRLERKPTKQTNLIKMHYTFNPKQATHVASSRTFV